MQRVLDEVVQAVGLATAIELVRGWGGRALAVPAKVHDHHPLALRLGLEPATRLVAAFRGRRLELPAERQALLDLRNAAIYREVTAGRSHESVGVEFGVSRQMVGVIVSKMRDRQDCSEGAPA